MNDPADHIPVLVDDVVGMLVRAEGGIYLDGTVGLGGHAGAILRAAGPRARLLGVDLDTECVRLSSRRLAEFGDRVLLVRGDYADLPELAREQGWIPADGIVLDLGISSYLLESSGRGFSFRKDEPLDMRFDLTRPRRAEDILNFGTDDELVRIFRSYGEEPLARRIARGIVARRSRTHFRSTRDLRTFVEESVPGAVVNKTLARVFQAIRVAVNDELDKLRDALPRLVDLLRPGGRLAVVSFHSLEDRIAKRTFRRLSGECVCPPRLPVCACEPEAKLRLVTRSVRPGSEEVRSNPRCRSAVLRVVERLPGVDPDGGSLSTGGE